jgi:hypothetical protein
LLVVEHKDIIVQILHKAIKFHIYRNEQQVYPDILSV